MKSIKDVNFKGKKVIIRVDFNVPLDHNRQIADDTAKLVKKYNGSLSGEHGDGRLRGEFIPYMLGEHNYKLFKKGGL